MSEKVSDHHDVQDAEEVKNDAKTLKTFIAGTSSERQSESDYLGLSPHTAVEVPLKLFNS